MTPQKKRIYKNTILLVVLFLFPSLLFCCHYYHSVKKDVYTMPIEQLEKEIHATDYVNMNYFAMKKQVICKDLLYDVQHKKAAIDTLREEYLDLILLNDMELIIHIHEIILITITIFFSLFLYYKKYLCDSSPRY